MRAAFHLLIGLCTSIGFALPALSAEQAPIIIIEGATLIDGTGADFLPQAVLVIEGDTIKTISQQDKIDKTAYPENATIIDVSGKFIIPGLIDMHVHYDDWMPELFLNHGVTSIVDLASHDWVFAQKEGVEKGEILGPRLFVSSFALDGRLFWNVPFFPLDGPEAASQAAQQYAHQGVNLLKTYTEIAPEELKAVVEVAHTAGLPVMGHLGSIDARQAAELGIDGLAHASGIALATIADPAKVKEMQAFETIGISVDYPHYLLYHAFMDEQKAELLIQLLIQEDVALEPDLINTSARWAAQRRDAYRAADAQLLQGLNLAYIPKNIVERILYNQQTHSLTPQEQELLKQGYANLQRFLRRFVEAGGKLLAGSDTASFVLPGISLHREMELFVEAGLSPMQALQTATQNNAEFLRQDHVGTLAVGKQADLLIVNGNPLQDIRHTQAIHIVMKGGKIVELGYHHDFQNPIPSPPPPWGYIAHPRPAITSISPMIASAGAQDVTITISGENFLANAQVTFGASTVPAQAIEASQLASSAYLRHYTQLQLSLPAQVLTEAGTFPIIVSNPPPEGGSSNAAHFIVKFP